MRASEVPGCVLMYTCLSETDLDIVATCVVMHDNSWAMHVHMHIRTSKNNSCLVCVKNKLKHKTLKID